MDDLGGCDRTVAPAEIMRNDWRSLRFVMDHNRSPGNEPHSQVSLQICQGDPCGVFGNLPGVHLLECHPERRSRSLPLTSSFLTVHIGARNYRCSGSFLMTHSSCASALSWGSANCRLPETTSRYG